MAFTYFFRDIQTLEMVRDHALPVMRSHKYINIWDAGCANGPEPYTLAIVLRENMGQFLFRNVSIFATDIDESNLFGDVINDGIYTMQELERIPQYILDRYFLPNEQPGHVIISGEIRKAVHFLQHDLLSLEPVRKELGLIVCKNVILHFTEEGRINVLKMFHSALAADGFLALEQTQKLPEEVEHLFEPVVSNAQLFKKVV